MAVPTISSERVRTTNGRSQYSILERREGYPQRSEARSALGSLISMPRLTMTNSMIIVLSPAKTLDLRPLPLQMEKQLLKDVDAEGYKFDFCDEVKTQHIAFSVKQRSKDVKELSKLLSCSGTLAAVAKTYWDEFDLMSLNSNPNDKEQGYEGVKKRKPALFMFDGPAYKGININSVSELPQTNHIITYLQHHLRIIDPLYGCLKPLDFILPYRLEMATKGVSKDIGKDMAAYWKDSITSYLIKDFTCMKNGKSSDSNKRVLLNLASDEYFVAIETAKLLALNINVVKVIFQEEGRVISTHAKRARGLMVRYLAENNVTSLEEIKKFHLEGYFFVGSEESTIVFNRKRQHKVTDKNIQSTRKRKLV